jgi:hypothetical protein
MVAKALPDFSRSALPNLTPRMAQFASKRDFGVCFCTTTPTKVSQPGADFLTAFVITNCNSLRVIGFRVGPFFQIQGKIDPHNMIYKKSDNSNATKAGWKAALGKAADRIRVPHGQSSSIFRAGVQPRSKGKRIGQSGN